jgi:hypothetical protein
VAKLAGLEVVLCRYLTVRLPVTSVYGSRAEASTSSSIFSPLQQDSEFLDRQGALSHLWNCSPSCLVTMMKPSCHSSKMGVVVDPCLVQVVPSGIKRHFMLFMLPGALRPPFLTMLQYHTGQKKHNRAAYRTIASYS